MKPYKILYIDEESSERHKFERAYQGQDSFEVDVMEPCSSVDECVEHIIREHYDGLVTDFRLKDHSKINYFGTEIVEKLLKIKDGFPVFVLTGFPNDSGSGSDDVAIHNVSDANIIYDKSALKDDHEKEKKLLEDKILTNITNYKDRINKSSERLKVLVGKSKLCPEEESELIRLDNFLEKSINAPSVISDSIKKQFLENKFDEVISLGRQILEKYSK